MRHRRGIVIGMLDGLTVPFALAAGLSGALSQAHVIVTAGLAEVTVGANRRDRDGVGRLPRRKGGRGALRE